MGWALPGPSSQDQGADMLLTFITPCPAPFLGPESCPPSPRKSNRSGVGKSLPTILWLCSGGGPTLSAWLLSPEEDLAPARSQEHLPEAW